MAGDFAREMSIRMGGLISRAVAKKFPLKTVSAIIIPFNGPYQLVRWEDLENWPAMVFAQGSRWDLVRCVRHIRM
jgi:hypothetical protein